MTAALVSAVLFGATFIGVSTLALAAGARLGFRRSVALLTAGYSVGQILGPLAVTPLLRHGYRQAVLLAAAVVLAAAPPRPYCGSLRRKSGDEAAGRWGPVAEPRP